MIVTFIDVRNVELAPKFEFFFFLKKKNSNWQVFVFEFFPEICLPPRAIRLIKFRACGSVCRVKTTLVERDGASPINQRRCRIFNFYPISSYHNEKFPSENCYSAALPCPFFLMSLNLIFKIN